MGIFTGRLERKVQSLKDRIEAYRRENSSLHDQLQLQVKKNGSALELLAHTLGYEWVSSPVKKGNGAELVWRWEKKAPPVPIEENPIMRALFPGLAKKAEKGSKRNGKKTLKKASS